MLLSGGALFAFLDRDALAHSLGDQGTGHRKGSDLLVALLVLELWLSAFLPRAIHRRALSASRTAPPG